MAERVLYGCKEGVKVTFVVVAVVLLDEDFVSLFERVADCEVDLVLDFVSDFELDDFVLLFEQVVDGEAVFVLDFVSVLLVVGVLEVLVFVAERVELVDVLVRVVVEVFRVVGARRPSLGATAFCATWCD